jgi:NitT/TauT family transport system permease protein
VEAAQLSPDVALPAPAAAPAAAPGGRRRRPPLAAVGLGLLGIAALLGAWYLAVDVLALPRFKLLPGPLEVLREWTSRHPAYGISLFTGDYWRDIWVSVRRVLLSFAAAAVLGVPLGLALGWSRRVHDHVFPVLEVLRPIPILAWVPLAILIFPGSESPVIFLTFLSAFFAVTLNTLLGVRSLDRDLVRAARCLGAQPRDVFRDVVIPGALPYIVTGLQVAMGLAWFSLVAGEMIAGRDGLGYLINSAYTTTRYPTIVIAMITLGIVGFASSAAVRLAGRRLIAHR